jgi:hypothetical protein
MRFRKALLCLFAALLLVAGCERDFRPLAEYATPAASIAPELNLGADGRVYLSWLQQQQDGHRLRYAVLDERGWSGPHTVVEGTDWLVGQMDWPGVTAFGDIFAAYWQRRRGTSGYASEIRIAFSADRGTTWKPDLPLHDDDTDTEHGFVSLLPIADRLHVIWLDGRETAVSHGGGGHGHAGATMLRHAVFDARGQRTSEVAVDARTCDCCHMAAAPIPGGFIIAYRDRSDAEIRDIVTRRYVNGTWLDPVPVHADGWKLDGCPVNGPSIASTGTKVAVAWFTGAGELPRVLAAVSENGGGSFAPPVRIDEGRALGRVDIAPLPDGDMAVAWAELDNDTAVFKLRRFSLAGGGAAGAIRRLPAESPSGFPRMVAQGPGIVVAWTEGEGGAAARVRAMAVGADEL